MELHIKHLMSLILKGKIFLYKVIIMSATVNFFSNVYIYCILLGCGPIGLLAIGLAKVMGATKMYNHS